jgi:glucan phosphoethanolaminetransferase (alkaline phosphatase superfamily)
MRNLIHSFHDHVTFAKIICLVLLFSPLFGFWWFNVDNNFFQVWVAYSLKCSLVAIVVFTSVSLLAIAGFLIVTFIRPTVIRLPLMLVMLIGWAFELSVLDLNSTLSSQNLFWILWQNREDGPQVLGAYGSDIIRDCAAVALLGIVLCAPPSKRISVSGLLGLLPFLAGGLVTGVILSTKAGTEAFPIPFATFTNASIVLVGASNGASWPHPDPNFSRDVVTLSDANIEGAIRPIFDKIVIIMDESVRGDSLSLNGATLDTTPFLKSANHLINFGVATSGANCSSVSRAIFRFGMRQSDLPNKWREGLSRPTIWQLAHRAGYKTVHINAWSNPLLQRISGLSPAEEAQVDSNVTMLENPKYLRDHRLVESLLAVLKDEGPAFIYVDKFGIHFPYSDKYPPNFHAFPDPVASEPSNLKQGSLAAFLQGFMPPSGKDFSASEIVHYPNAIAWSVDDFFRKLLPGLDLSKTLILYTSDHGQSLLPAHPSHCSWAPTVPEGEAYVPLFAATALPEFEQRLKRGAAAGFNRFSHFEIFPTLLLAMGYDPDWIKRVYGPTLEDSPSPSRTFMVGAPGYKTWLVRVDPKFASLRK